MPRVPSTSCPGPGRAGRLRRRALALLWAGLSLLPALRAVAVDRIPILWEAGGASAGNDSAGQAARMAVDRMGNLAIVSGPSLARDLAVTSYTADGALRWRVGVTPASGVLLGDWVAATPGGDVVAAGRNVSMSSGNAHGITLMGVSSAGDLRWRVDLSRTLPTIGRLIVDRAGNSYLAFNSIGDGQDIEVHSYDPAGTLRWSAVIGTGALANDYATSLALDADETEVAVTGDTLGGAQWITALYDATTGARRWLTVAPEGIAALDVLVEPDQVLVTGQGNIGITGVLSVVALDRATGARGWRLDEKPADASDASGLRIARAPGGTYVVAGQAVRGFLDWYAVALDAAGNVLWEAIRDGGLNSDEIPSAVFVLDDGTAVLSGKGGPNLPGGYVPGVTAGFSASGVLLWEAFSPFATTWAASLPNGNACATGGYDAYVACFGLATHRVGMVPDGRWVPGEPLRVTRPAIGELLLSWSRSCVPTDTDHAVYSGVLGGVFDHHVSVACSTGGAQSAIVPEPPGDAYYLVSSHEGRLEGSHGLNSRGEHRSSGPAPCLPTSGILGCP